MTQYEQFLLEQSENQYMGYSGYDEYNDDPYENEN